MTEEEKNQAEITEQIDKMFLPWLKLKFKDEFQEYIKKLMKP